MRSFFLLPLVLLLVFVPSCAPTKGYEAPYEVVKSGEYVVDVSATDDGVKHVGRGVNMSGGYILTAAHIFPDAYQENSLCSVTHKNEEKYEERILFLDRENDVAILSSAEKNGCLLSYEIPAAGYCFSPEGKMRRYDVTIVKTTDGTEYAAIRENFPKGTSGAPLFSDTGAVIGIFIARKKGGGDAFATPIFRADTLPLSRFFPQGYSVNFYIDKTLIK